jgi:hypothetical protein
MYARLGFFGVDDQIIFSSVSRNYAVAFAAVLKSDVIFCIAAFVKKTFCHYYDTFILMLIYAGTIEVSPLWRWRRTMTWEFVDGMIVVMLPSMLTVAWLTWRAA